MLKTLPWCLALVLLLTGCLGRTEGKGESGDPANRHQRNIIERRLVLNVSGDVSLDYESDDHVMHFVHFAPTLEGLKAASVATVSTQTPIPYGQDLGLIVGISVVGNYTGDGTYEIGVREFTEGPSLAPSGLSVIRVEIYDLSEKQIPNSTVRTPIPVMSVRLENRGPACTVVLAEKATRGSLDCPEIASEDGDKIVAVKMSWGPPN